MSNVIATYRMVLCWIEREGWPWISSHKLVIAGMIALLLAGRRGHPHVLAEDLPLDIEPRSKIAKVRRMLSSEKQDPKQLLPVLLRVGLELRPDRRWVILALDRTEYQERGVWVQVLMVSLVLDGRTQPLFWLVRNAQGNTPLKCWKRVLAPVIRELRLIPELEQATWLVLADREFVSMPFARWLQDVMKVDYALRLKANMWLYFEDDTCCQVRDLPLKKGETKGWSQVSITDRHQWPGQVAACWHPDSDGPLVLMHSLTGPWGQPRQVLQGYGFRFHIEPTFSDFKSRGFDLENIRMTDPQRLTILLMVFVLVMLWYLLTGHDLEAAGRTPAAPKCHPRAKRLRSWFCEGRRAWKRLLDQCRPSRLRGFLRKWLQALIRGSPFPLVEV